MCTNLLQKLCIFIRNYSHFMHKNTLTAYYSAMRVVYTRIYTSKSETYCPLRFASISFRVIFISSQWLRSKYESKALTKVIGFNVSFGAVRSNSERFKTSSLYPLSSILYTKLLTFFSIYFFVFLSNLYKKKFCFFEFTKFCFIE